MHASHSVAAVLLTALCISAAGQTTDGLVGVWKIVSVSSIRPNGERVAVYGDHPIGFLTYLREGRMSVVIGDGDRKPLSGEDRQSTTTAERAEAFSTFNAYAGRYTLDGDKVIHHVEVALFQNWVKTDQIRFMTLRGDRLTLRSPPRMIRGEQRTQELIWERVK